MNPFSIGVFYSDDNNCEVCCHFVTAQVAIAINNSPEVGDKEADYVNNHHKRKKRGGLKMLDLRKLSHKHVICNLIPHHSKEFIEMLCNAGV